MKCKLCKEERELFMNGMCMLCYQYLQDRLTRICKEQIDKTFSKEQEVGK